MPRSVSTPFSYQYPAGTTAVSGHAISSVAYNSANTDMANNVFNAAWPITYGGTGTTDGSSLVPDGNATTPGVRFQSEPTTGVYRVSAGVIGVSILGVQVGTFTATGQTSTLPISITGSTAAFTPFQGISTEAGAAAGPIIDLYRNSASPAASDVIGELDFNGKDSGPAKQRFGYVKGVIIDPTSASEDGQVVIGTVIAGTEADRVKIGAGLYTAGATGGDQGVNTANASAYYTDGVYSTITPWVAYTPTFTGFGTATAINFRSRKVGNTLEVMGTFTPGTTTATEGRITLGFNGTSANVSVDSTLGTRTVAGVIAFNTAFAGSGVTLIEASQTFFCLGLQTATTNSSYVKALGNVFTSSVTLSVTALVPLS